MIEATNTLTEPLSRRADGRHFPGLQRRSRAAIRSSDPLVGWVITIAITSLASILRFVHLGRPNSFLFDETYYAKQAWSLIHHGYAQSYVDGANAKILDGHWNSNLWTGDPEMIVHPEVGKWLIGAGEALFWVHALRLALRLCGGRHLNGLRDDPTGPTAHRLQCARRHRRPAHVFRRASTRALPTSPARHL
ncbi:MAG: hypothetical protein V9E81_09150 [Marmoricola sp.]